MADAIKSFVVTQNIAHYKMLLQNESDAEKRGVLCRLLKEEIGKLPASAKRTVIAKTSQFSMT